MGSVFAQMRAFCSYNLPLNLFIGDKRKVPLVDVVVWAKKRIFPKNRMDCKGILKMMGLPDYNAWEIVKRTNACLDGRSLLAAIQRRGNLCRYYARKIQKNYERLKKHK